MSVGLVFVLGLLLWTGSTGDSVVTQLRFVQTGTDVTLDIMDPAALEGFLLLQWKYNNTKVLVSVSSKGEATVNSERVVYHPQNYSVTLKNLQKADSGLYEAHLIKTTEQITISKFLLTVKDPVSPVKLTVDSVSNSSESCNFTVSCSTADFKLNHSFTCNNQICDDKQEQTQTTPSAASLHLYLSNMFIICNHSNQVSWRNDTTDLKQICPPRSKDYNDSSKGSAVGVAGAVAGVGVVVGVVVVIIGIAAALPPLRSHLFYRRRRQNKGENQENTVYASPQVSPAPESASSPGNTSVDSPTSTYSLVGPHTAVIPESQYATVGKK